ncbi:uncharacterized protein LOC134800618 [Cydia splendana]|uniref:uncharacterized protein LOC134800618 n=1 Tax=Cydia splendana TaxID=1100963 RepID=UPI00300D6836
MEHNTPTQTACIMEPEKVYVKTEPDEMCVKAEPIELFVKTEPREACVTTEPGEVCVITEPGEVCVITEPGEVCVNTEPREVCVKTEHGEAGEVCVKTEPGEYVKERECDDDAGSSGVSAAAAQVELYTDHEVKDELVLGPEEWHRPKVLPVQGINSNALRPTSEHLGGLLLCGIEEHARLKRLEDTAAVGAGMPRHPPACAEASREV